MNLASKSVMVTGGAGFIGSHLTDALVEAGARVVVLDNLSTGNLRNLERSWRAIRFIEGDIRRADIVREAAAGCDVIFHQAAVVSVPYSVRYPQETAEVNEMGTLNVLEAARENNVRRVVLASSCAVYGDSPQLPKTEAMPVAPRSPYALQKYVGERYAHLYGGLYGLEAVALRYFNVYGPRQDPSSPYSGVISIFMQKAISDQQPTIFGDGNQSRDFIYVGDVVRANLLAARRSGTGGVVLNVGRQEAATVNDLWRFIEKLAGRRLNPIHAEARPGDITASLADTEAARRALDFSAETPVQNGLAVTYEWYQRASAEPGKGNPHGR